MLHVPLTQSKSDRESGKNSTKVCMKSGVLSFCRISTRQISIRRIPIARILVL